MSVLAQGSPAFDMMAELIRARTGLTFSQARRADVESGTRRVMAAAGITDPAQSLDRLRHDQALFDRLVSELTIGETYFFREPAHFAFIRETAVPELRRLRGPDHILRLWSAGCASGEEPYSLAILFDEMGLANRVRILGTDISRAALRRAREAAYSAWSLRGEGTRLIGLYLRRSTDRFVLAERIRRRVDFAYLNLAQDNYPTILTNTVGTDLIVCRNVLIYLDAGTIRKVARRFHESLADGGFLIAGSSDPPLAGHAPFDVQATDAGIVYRKVALSRSRGSLPSAGLSHLDRPPEGKDAPETSPFDRVARSSASRAGNDEGGEPGESHAVDPLPPAAAISSQPSALPADPLAEAREALAGGDNARAIGLTRPALETDMHAAALCVRALANVGDGEAAVAIAAEAAACHPASCEISFLLAILLINLDRHGEAERVLRRVLYLDRSLAAVHFALGMTLFRLGDPRGSSRAYRSARDLAARRPRDEIVPLSDGTSAGRLAAAAQAASRRASPEADT